MDTFCLFMSFMCHLSPPTDRYPANRVSFDLPRLVRKRKKPLLTSSTIHIEHAPNSDTAETLHLAFKLTTARLFEIFFKTKKRWGANIISYEHFYFKIFFYYESTKPLRRNPPENWVILIFIGQKPCTRIIQRILHSFFFCFVFVFFVFCFTIFKG